MPQQLAFFDALTPGPPVAVEAPAAPPPEPEGQLDLFGGAALHLRAVCERLETGDFTGARRLASDLAPRLADAARWLRLLESWLHRIESCGEDPESLARLAEDGAALPAEGDGGLLLRTALLAGLHGTVASLAERSQPGAVVHGRPAGWHLLLANRPADAQRSLEATLTRGELAGMCCVLLGNIAFREGTTATARAHYQLAFLRDPAQVPVDQILDPAIPVLLDDAAELELDPPAAWVPLIGQARGLFGVAREPSAHQEVARFQALQQEARSGSTPARREMKALAPALFALLRDEGKR